MEQPSSLYLRGFVGSVYDGSSWESISTEKAYEEKDLFYWLHKDGFYGEDQLQNARNLIQDDSLSSEKGIISIKNKIAYGPSGGLYWRKCPGRQYPERQRIVWKKNLSLFLPWKSGQ